MWKIAVVLVLTTLAILMARLSYQAPLFDSRLGTATSLEASASAPLMYAGIRG